jgi:hypothetical protein
MLALLGVVGVLSGCAANQAGGDPAGGSAGSAVLRGFGVHVDQAVSARVPVVHLRTCGYWGCYEQDVPLSIAGPTSAGPCATSSSPAGAACGVVQLPGPGPGYGYAPVPGLTQDAVTVRVTTPPGAAMPVDAQVRVQPRLICPDQDATTCTDGTPQAQLRIAADGTVSAS